MWGDGDGDGYLNSNQVFVMDVIEYVDESVRY